MIKYRFDCEYSTDSIEMEFDAVDAEEMVEKLKLFMLAQGFTKETTDKIQIVDPQSCRMEPEEGR